MTPLAPDCEDFRERPGPTQVAALCRWSTERMRAMRLAVADHGEPLERTGWPDAIPQKVFETLKTARHIAVVAAARDRGIPVTNVPEYSTPHVVQATWALLLEHTNRVGHHDRTVHKGRWAASPDFCSWDGDLVELARLTLGVIGYGRICKGVADVACAMGRRVLYHRRQIGYDPECVDLDTLFCESDVDSLHCPLTPETKALVDARRRLIDVAAANLAAFVADRPQNVVNA